MPPIESAGDAGGGYGDSYDWNVKEGHLDPEGGGYTWDCTLCLDALDPDADSSCERPYVCDICQERFEKISHVRFHQRHCTHENADKLAEANAVTFRGVAALTPNLRWQVMLESGWTDFPPASNEIIVAAVRNGSTQAVVTARGIEYVVDTQVLTQFQKGDSSRQREIRCVSNADTGAGADAGAALDSANSSWLHGAITPVHNQPYRRPARVIESPSDGDGDADSIGGFGEVPVFDMTVEAPRDESPPPPPPPPPDDDSSVGVGAGEASAGAGVLLHTKHSAMAGVHEEFSDYVEMARISELPPPTVQPTPPTPPPPAQQQQQQQQQAARGAASTAGSGNGGSGLELGVSNRPPMNKDAASAVLAWGASVAAETPEHLPGTVGQ